MTTEIETCPGTELLNLCGARMIVERGRIRIGIWPDLDGPTIRQAIESVHLGEFEICYLDKVDIHRDYQVRRCPVRLPKESFDAWQKRAEAMRKQQNEMDAA